jgi:hypothetical protein
VISAPGTILYCPYCYEPFTEREIQFRCTGQISRTGGRCDPQVDTVLQDRTGFARALGPAFAADGRMTSAPCPQCGDQSTTRICPVCHSQLPVHFGKIRSRLIALVGAKESGKTVFMTVLVHELMHQVGDRLNAAISGADDNTRYRFASEYEQPLYRESRLLAPTTTAGIRNRVPIVFRFTTERTGRLGDGRLGWLAPGDWLRFSARLPFGARPGMGKPQHTLLSFFDTAGEDLRSQQSVEQNVRYLAAADGIVLLLDPLQMRGARRLAAPGARLPTPGDSADEPAAVLGNITDLVLARKTRKPNERIGKPLAVTFSKMDTLLHGLSETSSLLRPPAQTPYFDERDSLAVHTEVQRLLVRWDGARIDQLVQLHYRSYRYFGVSALGETPTQDNHVSPRGIRPYRVADPLMWILAHFGAIPVKRA